jgi:hypothetical protein
MRSTGDERIIIAAAYGVVEILGLPAAIKAGVTLWKKARQANGPDKDSA